MLEMSSSEKGLKLYEKFFCSPWPLLFWCSATFLLFFSLGYRSLWGSEGRWAEIAREMIISGDCFHPTINWEPYFDKPLFTYWVIVAVSWVTGSLSELTARLPGALAGLVTLWATISLGTRLFSRRAGYFAAWILLTSYGFIFWSRTACADIENVAFILLAVLWYWTRRERPGFVSYAVFYLICATGAHFKGLPAAVLPGIVCLPDVLREGRWRRYLSASHAAALCLGVFLYLAPFLYAAFTAENYGESGLYLVFRENILRFFSAFDHQEPFYVYIYYVPMLFLPWAPFLVAALIDAFRHYRYADIFHKWLVEAILIVFLIYTLSESRRSYYILPIMPFCAIAAGNFLAGAGRRTWGRKAVAVQLFFVMFLAATEILAPAISPFVSKFTGVVPPDGLASALFVTGAAAMMGLFLLWKRGIPACQDRDAEDAGCQPRVAAVLAATLILTAGFYCWQQNILETYRPHRAFLQQVREAMGDIEPCRVGLSKNIAWVVFYLDFRGPVSLLETPKDVEEFMSAGGKRFLVVQRRALNKAFSIMPDDMKRKPFMASSLYPGQRRKKMQLLVWMLDEPAGVKSP
jgi:4-amino-4-deoxy-L-arabinose transferase-like glycosyltransferase